jgi:hypothetical protein
MKLPEVIYGRLGQVVRQNQAQASKLNADGRLHEFGAGPMLDTATAEGLFLVDKEADPSEFARFHCYLMPKAITKASPQAEIRTAGSHVNCWRWSQGLTNERALGESALLARCAGTSASSRSSEPPGWTSFVSLEEHEHEQLTESVSAFTLRWAYAEDCCLVLTVREGRQVAGGDGSAAAWFAGLQVAVTELLRRSRARETARAISERTGRREPLSGTGPPRGRRPALDGGPGARSGASTPGRNRTAARWGQPQKPDSKKSHRAVDRRPGCSSLQ